MESVWNLVSGLPMDELLLEIDAVVVLPEEIHAEQAIKGGV